MTNFEKIYHPPRTAPGTLVSHHGAIHEELNIHLIDYRTEGFVETDLSMAQECLPYLENESVTWIHLQGPIHADSMTEIGNIFDLHPLSLEDVMNKGQRPKVDDYEDLMFIIMSTPIESSGAIEIKQLSIFMSNNYIITFHDGDKDPFEPLRKRLRKNNSRIRSLDADYLLYSILDLVIDLGYPVLESIDEKIESIDNELLSSSAKQSTLVEIHYLRRQLLLLRRNLWPQREVINNLLRNESPLIKESTSIYLRDCYDHTIQIMDLIENYRDMSAGLIDIYLSSTSHRLNEIMRVLTMIATIFIPLSFVVGLYGMNFSNPDSPWSMPELNWYYGYPIVWGVMIALVVSMIVYFKRKEWL